MIAWDTMGDKYKETRESFVFFKTAKAIPINFSQKKKKEKFCNFYFTTDHEAGLMERKEATVEKEAHSSL